MQQKVHIKTVFHKIWQKVAIRTIHINSLVNVLHTVMCTQYNRIQVELRTCTKWTVHVSCGMFRALDVCTPDWFIAVFWSFHSYTGVSLTINHGILHWNTDWLDYYNSPSITVKSQQRLQSHCSADEYGTANLHISLLKSLHSDDLCTMTYFWHQHVQTVPHFSHC